MEPTNQDLDSFELPYCDYVTFERIKELNPTLALAYIEAIMNYGFRREKPDKDSPPWILGLGTSFALIDGTIEREAEIWAEIMSENDD